METIYDNVINELNEVDISITILIYKRVPSYYLLKEMILGIEIVICFFGAKSKIVKRSNVGS